MAAVNKVILVGNLGRDPEVRYTANGNAMCNLSIATTFNSKDSQTGERREETEWHCVVMFNRLAEIAGEYLSKGRPVYIEGRLRTRKWQGQDGQGRYTTEIIADHMQMLGGRADINEPAPQAAPESSKQNEYGKQTGSTRRNYQTPSGGIGDMDDDIPFAPLLARNVYCI